MSSLSKVEPARTETIKPRELNPFQFTAERDLELSASLGQLGIYQFNAQTGPRAANPLSDGKKEFEHLQDVLRRESRTRAREDLQFWKGRKRVKLLVKKRATDQLVSFLTQLLAQKQDDNIDHWLVQFADAGSLKLVELIEEHGVPELVRIARAGSAGLEDTTSRAELSRIAQMIGKSTEAGKSFLVWFRFLDILCDKKIAPSRIAWLFKTVNLLNEKKRGDDLRVHLFPKASAEVILQWLSFGLREMSRSLTPAPLARGAVNVQIEIPIADRMRRWRHGASLLRWLFEDGLLRTSFVLEELLKMLRLVFGSPAEQSTTNARVSPVTVATPATQQVALKLPEKMQLLVVSEVVSYAPDALKMGYVTSFYESCKAVMRNQFSQQQVSSLELLSACVKLCRKALGSNGFDEAIWKEDNVGLSWALENAKNQLRNDSLEFKCGLDNLDKLGFTNRLNLCLAVLEWIAQSSVEEIEDNSCVGFNVFVDSTLGPSRIDLRRMFDIFLSRKGRSELELKNCASVLSLLLAVGVSIDTRTPAWPSARNVPCFLEVLNRTSFASPGSLKHVHAETMNSFIKTVSDRRFCLESVELVRQLHELAEPGLQMRALTWLFETVEDCSVNLALIPFLESSPTMLNLLRSKNSWENVVGIASRAHKVPYQPRESLVEQLRAAVNLRLKKMSEIEGDRLRELLHLKSQKSTSQQRQPDIAPPLQQRQIKTKSIAPMTLAGLFPEGSPTLTAGDTPAASPVESQESFFDTSCVLMPGFEGERLRYYEGIRLIADRFEKIAGTIRDAYSKENFNPIASFPLVLRDLMSCRSRDDREQLAGWCLTTLEQSSPIEVIDAGLCRLEDVLNKWLPKKFVPAPEALAKCLKSRTFLHQIRAHHPTVARFALLLADQPANEEYASFLRVYYESRIARGPFKNDQSDPFPEVSPAVRAMLGNRFPENYLVSLDEWSVARQGWFYAPDRNNKDSLSRWAMSCCTQGGEERIGAVAASVVLAWQAQDTLCALAKDSLGTNEAQAVLGMLVTRCLGSASDRIRMDYVHTITKHLTDELDENREEIFLRILCAAISAAPGTVLDAEPALQLLVRINPVLYKRLTLELIKRCNSAQRQMVAGLIETWKAKWQNEISFFNTMNRLVGADTGPIDENLVLCGDSALNLTDVRFVDSWSVLEGAKESYASYEFLRGAVIRSSTRN